MKLALLGAPGSGKTLVARRVSKLLQKENPGQTWSLVDGYVEKLAKRTGRPFGVEAMYNEHMAVVTARWVAEWEAEAKGHHTITCGSIYESMIYASVLSFVPQSEADMLDFQRYSEASMVALGTFAQIEFDYDALFYLPWRDPTEDELHSWDGVINTKIPEVLSGHRKYAVPLNGTDKERVSQATDIIQRIIQASSDDQPAV